MQITGIVRKIENENAYVVIKRQSACGENCANCGGCTAKENEVRVKKAADVKPGDNVIIEMSDKKVLGAAFFVYIFPLLIFFMVYAVLFAICANEAVCILSGTLITVFYYILLHFKDKKNAEKYMHKIIKKIERE